MLRLQTQVVWGAWARYIHICMHAGPTPPTERFATGAQKCRHALSGPAPSVRASGTPQVSATTASDPLAPMLWQLDTDIRLLWMIV